MELKKIRYFLQIVDRGSLSRAAESLYLTQPTLSRFLANLEDEAGVKLFSRGRDNSLTLTESGKLYLEAARTIDAIWTQLEQDLAAQKNGISETILLGIDADSLLSFASSCADKLSAQFPNVSVQILRQGAFEIRKQLLDGALDLGLTAYEDEDSRLVYHPTRTPEVDLIVHWNHPLSRYSYRLPGQEGMRISLDVLEPGTLFALIRKNTVLRQLVDHRLADLSLEPMIARTYDLHRSAVDIVAESPELVGFCPASYKTSRVANLALDPPFFYKNGICHRADAKFTPAVLALIELLKQQPTTRNLDLS